MSFIVPVEKECANCGSRYNLDKHHIFYGAYRKKSDIYGLLIYLCRNCHTNLHNGKLADFDTFIKDKYQRIFEEKYSHEFWMLEFGKNFKGE